MIKIKNGVDMSGLDHRLWKKARPIAAIFAKHGLDAVITSARRAPGGRFSWHHEGKAYDWRAKHIESPRLKRLILQEISNVCGRKFDVILHGEGNNIHYHVEYDPK